MKPQSDKMGRVVIPQITRDLLAKAVRSVVIGPNRSEHELDNGTRILVDYATPVAAYIVGRGYIRTSTHYSVTTSRHINKWLDGVECETVEQSEIDGLI